MKPATCHPDAKHYARGLCASCYRRKFLRSWVTKTKAKCHPDRPMKSRGLCNACYLKLRASGAFTPTGRKCKKNTCGHPSREHESNGMCKACYTRHWRSQNPDRDSVHRTTTRLNRYGLSKVKFDSLLEEQQHACAICRRGLSARKETHVDHCHETGRVRGILCFTCNKALGMLGDNEHGLLRALEYIRAA